MSIPDKAVEAAAQAMRPTLFDDSRWPVGSATESARRDVLKQARAGLEAAEPYLTGGSVNVPRGLYRNTQGAELRVLGTIGTRIGIDVGTDQLSADIAYAESVDDPYFKGRYLVTNFSLKQCGYELIDPEEVES